MMMGCYRGESDFPDVKPYGSWRVNPAPFKQTILSSTSAAWGICVLYQNRNIFLFSYGCWIGLMLNMTLHNSSKLFHFLLRDFRTNIWGTWEDDIKLMLSWPLSPGQYLYYRVVVLFVRVVSIEGDWRRSEQLLLRTSSQTGKVIVFLCSSTFCPICCCFLKNVCLHDLRPVHTKSVKYNYSSIHTDVSHKIVIVI